METGSKHKLQGYKKGQAALEYLITYGWALIIIVGIIALLYAYVFKPEFYIVESCSMAPGVECGSFVLAQSGPDMVLNLTLKSEMDFKIKIKEINMTTDNFLGAGEVTYSGTPGNSGNCNSYCAASIPSDPILERGNIPITFQFSIRGSEVPKPATLQRMKFSIMYEIVDLGNVNEYRTAGVLNVKVS